MTRDDSSGGWLAQDGGALTRVGVCRLLPPELAPTLASSTHGNTQFLIRGERLRDKQVKGEMKHFAANIHRMRIIGHDCDRPHASLRSIGHPRLPAEEGPGLHHCHTHISSLEGGGQEVWPILPESGRRQGLRQGSTESHRGSGRR